MPQASPCGAGRCAVEAGPQPGVPKRLTHGMSAGAESAMVTGQAGVSDKVALDARGPELVPSSALLPAAPRSR